MKKKEKNINNDEKSLIKFKNNSKKKWLVSGVQTLIIVAVIIATYIGINILLDNVVLPEVDLTKDKLYSLSQETKDKIGNIDKEVKITLINYDKNETMLNIMDKYKALSNKVEIERVDDLTSRKDLMQEYLLETTDSLILVQSGELKQEITQSDLYTIDYTTYQSIDTTEEAITNAIVNVTTEKKPKLYFMTNHIAYSAN